MNKRKAIFDLFVIMIAFALFVIWYESNYHNTVRTTSSTMQNYKIYLITMDKTSQYWSIVNQGASDMANILGTTVIWDAPETRIVTAQIDIINNAVKNRADALMIAASDPVKVSRAIEDAKAVGVKIIYVDAPANEEGIVTLATDNYSAGVTAGTTMLLELENAGMKSGTIGIIGVTPENATTMNRERGFRSVIAEDGRFQLLGTQYAAGDKVLSDSFANNFIAQNEDLVGLFGVHEDSTVSVGTAIQASNKNIIGIGFDLTEQIQEMINNGSLKAVIIQNPYTMGYLGMAETVAALKGFDTGPPYINTGFSVITKSSH